MHEALDSRRPAGSASGADAASALAGFHPAVRRWFEETFDEPTPPQTRGWAAIRSGRDTLIAAPTGSGKTLAAFLDALDRLLREGIGEGGLPDEARVVYVSPLKALSADIHRNLAEPRKGIRRIAREMDLPPIPITAAVRSGDTPRSERRAMLRTPPHIVVTTPESLYLLLTAERSREMLRTVRTVIVDEIHAVLDSRRGSHLSLSLERLRHVAGRPLQRIGLSATQRPIEEVGRFLVGGVPPGGEGERHVGESENRGGGDGGPGDETGAGPDERERPDPVIVDEGHHQEHDLGVELPGSPLEAVMSGEVWEEVYDRLAALVREHRSTLVFVNTRRLAERVARALAERLGEEAVTSHHGSLSKETRLDAERRLKEGELPALVATASLELGIDIGYVDLVCQLGTPNRIATFLQRVGRSGHTVGGTPKGRLFPLSRDDLVQGAALLRSVGEGELDRQVIPEAPLDILSQQIVAEAACEEWDEEALFRLVRGAHPYRTIGREEFGEVVEMAARGFATRRGRRGARIHHDAVNGRIRGRKGARLAAITSGGAIPDNADYRVVKEPEGTYLGTLNEDFAIESLPGDIFQLGNTSWRILRVETGVVRVEDARGEPPNIPFWLGEAPSRSPELSEAVAALRAEVETRLGEATPERAAEEGAEDGDGDAGGADREEAVGWLLGELPLSRPAAEQIVAYLDASRRVLGRLPTRETLVLERFFDESGGMQLVLHAPFGSRLNRAWGLALRKRFCRQFNFELQAAATEEGVLLSLGPQHSFPLEDVFDYLHPDSVREVLVQALLDAPMFLTRWRWNATLSLALLRWKGGSKVAPQIQRMEAEDLLAAVFPDATACLENVAGEREVPDHPLVRQTIRDCLEEAMDLPRLRALLRRIRGGELELVTRDTPEPSPLSHEILTARPYAYLDDAPLEERRAQAVHARRALDPSAAAEMGALDADAIRRVREEAWPEASDPDELHDALLTHGFLREEELEEGWADFLGELADQGRAVRLSVGAGKEAEADPGEGVGGPPEREAAAGGGAALWVPVERLLEGRLVWPGAGEEPALSPPERVARRPEGREEAAREMVRGRMELAGPATAAELAEATLLPADDVERALLALEGEGAVLRGRFRPGAEGREWCERRLLARIHRSTLDRLRSEIRPVSAADYMRFLFRWQRALPGHRVAGPEGVAAVVELLEGYELPAVAWEPDVLALRCEEYDPEHLDRLCAAGRVAWGRFSPPGGDGSGLRTSGPLRTTPVTLWPRESGPAWLAAADPTGEPEPTTEAAAVLEALRERGASFFHELVEATGLLPTQVERALGELAAFGLATSDGFAGLRALLTPSDKRRPLGNAAKKGRRRRRSPYGVDTAGRWSLLRDPAGGGPRGGEEEPGTVARALLRRYGVVFRRLLEPEAHAPPWRELLLIYRRMEARGEIRGGRFVAGFSGEQFALPEAVGSLRKVRSEEDGEVLVVSAADPLNLTGVVTPGERIPAVPSNRILFRGGVPAWVLESGEVRSIAGEEELRPELRRRLSGRSVPPALRAYA